MKHIEAGKPFQVAGDKIAVQLASYPTTLHYTVDAEQGWTDWSEQITEKNVAEQVYYFFDFHSYISSSIIFNHMRLNFDNISFIKRPFTCS